MSKFLSLFFFLVLTLTSVSAATYYVRTDGNDLNTGLTDSSGGAWQTVTKAIATVVAGDTIMVGNGNYNEIASTVRDGTSSNRIIIDGQNVAIVKQLRINHDYITFKNLRVSGVTQENSYLVYLNGGDYTILDNCDIDINYALRVQGIDWKTSNSSGSSDCIIQNCIIQKAYGTTMAGIGGTRNIFRNNVVKDGYMVDFLRLHGSYNLIQGNIFQNNLNATVSFPQVGNHPDWIQTFGDNGEESYGHTVEKNYVKNIEGGGLTQMNSTGMSNIRDWVFKNNIIIDVANTASCTVPGVKWYNNTFYRSCYNNEGHALSFGVRAFYGEQLWDGHPEYALTVPEKFSGDILPGVWYKVFEDDISQTGGILEGQLYRAITKTPGRILYNGIEYTNGQTFTGVAGVSNWSKIGTNVADLDVRVSGNIVYNGGTYLQSGTFTAAAFLGVEGVTTFTNGAPAQQHVFRQVVDFANGCEAKNNIFLNCGKPTGIGSGWYSFNNLLSDVSADYNYVSKQAFAQTRIDSLQRSIGDPGGWAESGDRWWEDNGINGGDPSMNDFTNFDFRLLEGSILIDQGIDITGVNSDYIGTIRPLGTETDIGAYEFDDGNPPPPPEDPPVAPSGLTSSEIRETNITLTWSDNSTDETSFELQRSLNGALWGNQASIPLNTTSYQVTGLTSSTTYYWRIRAISSVGNSEWSNTYSVATNGPPPPQPPPIAPSNLIVTIVGPNRATLTWIDNSSDEENFELSRSFNGLDWVTTSFPAANTQTFESTELSPATTYYWRIRAISGSGLLLSSWSNTVTGTTPVVSSGVENRQRSGALLKIPID